MYKCDTAFETDQKSSSNFNKHGAWAYTQFYVEQLLKSPKTADFPSAGYQHVSLLDDNTYQVKSFVDSQNLFGATIRTHFRIVLTEKGENDFEVQSFEWID